MAHSISAKKRVRQNAKRRAQNRARKEVIKTQVKNFQTAIAGGDLGKAESELNLVVRRLDRVASKGTIHKNTAARRRSRLTKKLNATRAAKAGEAKAGASA